jgi:hypothetical protein
MKPRPTTSPRANLYPHLGRLGMAQLEGVGVEQMDIWCSSKGDE